MKYNSKEIIFTIDILIMGRKLDNGKRVTKKTKNKEKKKRYGTKTSKHIRISEELREKKIKK